MIRIKFVDMWDGFEKDGCELKEMIMEMGIFKESDNPQIVVYSLFGNAHKYYNCIKLFFTGEYVYPDFNECDYAIGFHYIDRDNYLRYPLWRTYRKYVNMCLERQLIKKTKFCSFTVSNPKCKMRNEMYKKLSEYRTVDSGGAYMNNIGGICVKDKFAFDREHKFSICFENSEHEGYTTEKIIQSYAAGCIPIYWGDSKCEFNDKAYITGKTIEEIYDKVVKVDFDDELYEIMLKEPLGIKTDDSFKEFILKIVRENNL